MRWREVNDITQGYDWPDSTSGGGSAAPRLPLTSGNWNHGRQTYGSPLSAIHWSAGCEFQPWYLEINILSKNKPLYNGHKMYLFFRPSVQSLFILQLTFFIKPPSSSTPSDATFLWIPPPLKFCSIPGSTIALRRWLMEDRDQVLLF